MRLIYAPLIAFVLGATSANAFADAAYRPQVIPSCELYETPAGEVCGYLDIEDWKAVLRADAELVHARATLTNEAAKAAALSLQLEELGVQVGAYANSQSVLVERNATLTKQLLDLDLKYQEERVRSGWGSPIAWTIAGVSTAVLAGFLISGALN